MGIILIYSCNSTKLRPKELAISYDDIYLFQNGKETLINNVMQELEIKRDKFAIRFYNKRYDSDGKKFHSAKISAFLDKTDLDNIKIGMAESELPYFSPGTGMASSQSGKYENLIFKKNAHHYLIYENSESKRLNLVDDLGEYLKLEFEVSNLFINGEIEKMSETELKEFYLVILIDKNLNEVIDKGELNKLLLKIKS